MAATTRLHRRNANGHLPRWLGLDENTDAFRIYAAPGGPSSGHAVADMSTEYPFPTIDVELERLRARWEAAGGPRGDDSANREGQLARQRFEASAPGDSWDSRTARMRRLIREL